MWYTWNILESDYQKPWQISGDFRLGEPVNLCALDVYHAFGTSMDNTSDLS